MPLITWTNSPLWFRYDLGETQKILVPASAYIYCVFHLTLDSPRDGNAVIAESTILILSQFLLLQKRFTNLHKEKLILRLSQKKASES